MIMAIQKIAQDPHFFSYMVCVGNIAITTHDRQFFGGIQCGYNEFLLAYQGKILTKKDVYATCIKIVDLKQPSTYQAGFITGWMAAMLEPMPNDTQCKLIEIVQEGTK